MLTLQAIEYAVDVWEVDIISMSFGFVNHSRVIAQAIRHARNRGVLLIAAAGNNGSTEQVRYPARDTNVLCIHAATGFGNMFNGNPTRKDNTTNFALLGVALKGYAPAGQTPAEVRRSGTSQATAVAAGVAALIIQIMRDSEDEVRKMGWTPQSYASAFSQLKDLDGMRKVFEKMSTQRGDYEIVTPWLLLDRVRAVEPSMVLGQVCNTIMTLMEDYDEDE
jgi:subtilisin family serine protease